MTTRDEVLEACLDFEEAACRKGASCRGDDEVAFDLCLLQAEVTCNRQVDRITCWDGLAAGYEECLELEDAACEDLCDDEGVCVFSCTFECPEATAAG